MQITTIGLDIAKNVFQVHGIDMTHKRNQVLHATLDVELQARRDRPASLGKQPWDRVFRLYGEMALGRGSCQASVLVQYQRLERRHLSWRYARAHSWLPQ
jgi:hypothetical protein